MEREIAFDTETTGFEPKEGHRIVEIGCVEMMGHVRTGKTFHCYINPERDIPPQAQAVHGLTEAFLKKHSVFKAIAESFLEFVGDATLVAHNATFDMKFINHELKEAGFAPFPASRSKDTLEMARRNYPGQPASLDALCRRFDIDLSMRTKHGALLDAELLADVYLELMGGKQSSLVLQKQQQQSIATNESTPKTDFPKRYFALSDEEQQHHKAFIEKHLKEPLWHRYNLLDKAS
jgi:DNA polymerase III subunit epsilon